MCLGLRNFYVQVISRQHFLLDSKKVSREKLYERYSCILYTDEAQLVGETSRHSNVLRG